MTIKNRLVILVEGNRDEDFIEWIVKPILIGAQKYYNVIPYKFARMPKNINKSYIKTVVNMNDDILCLTDITGFPCKRAKKEQVQRDHIGYIGEDKVIIVIREIESWYLAGLSQSCCRRLRIDYYDRTDNIDKEKFHQIIAKSKFKPKWACALEMLRDYEVMLAKQKNRSFNYFHENHLN